MISHHIQANRPPRKSGGTIFIQSLACCFALLPLIWACGPGKARELLAGTDQIDIALYSENTGRMDSSQILSIQDKASINNFLLTLDAPQKPRYPGQVIGKVHFRRVRVHSSLILAELYAQDTLQELVFEYKGQTYAWPLSADSRDFIRLAFTYPMFFPKLDPSDDPPPQ